MSKSVVFMVQYAWATVGVCSKCDKAIAMAHEAHKLDGFGHSVWVTRWVVDAPFRSNDNADVEIGMLRSNPERTRSNWIAYHCDWGWDEACLWVPRKL